MTNHRAITHGIGPEAGADLAGAALALARRFASGATLWCIAPEWPEHARHVAVEFVHPVIMGKRALPAVAVHDDDLVGGLRAVTRTGDIVCAVATAAAPGVADAMRRAGVWGLTTVWIGAGERPEAGRADHVLWVDAAVSGAGDTAAFDGSLMLRYHVLWELTHVCFEHPGLLSTPDDDACDADGRCITCSDDGTLAEIVTVDAVGAASVRTAAGIEVIDVNLVTPVGPGDLVLVHAGTAIALVEAESGEA